jgi:ribosomal protein L40E
VWIAGLGLLLAGVVLLVFGGFFFLTIILIPIAIIAALIGIILVVIGGLAVIARGVLYAEHHATPVHAYEASQTVKYCTRCGAPNPKEAAYCAICGKQFLE